LSLTVGNNVSGVNAALSAGDANGDNIADISDLLLLTAAYNTQQGVNPNYNAAADFTSDGFADISDLLLLIGNYNTLGDAFPISGGNLTLSALRAY